MATAPIFVKKVKNNPKKQNAGLFESVEKAVLQVLLTVVFSLIKVLKWSKFSRADLAQKLTVSVRLISYWENGQRECDFDTLIKIVEIFNVSVDFLLGRVDY